MQPAIEIKRVYAPFVEKEGMRVLVDRLWPRGMSKATAHIDQWAKDLAPSPALRKWYNHVVERWPVFKKKYMEELKQNPAVDSFLSEHSNDKKIVLVFGAKDEAHNQAVVLKSYLVRRFAKSKK